MTEILLACACGNRDSLPAPMTTLPPCSAACGRTMYVIGAGDPAPIWQAERCVVLDVGATGEIDIVATVPHVARAAPVTSPAWPDPTPEMLVDPRFEAIWQCIKTWDIHVPAAYVGYCGATGNHARAIFDALEQCEPTFYTQDPAGQTDRPYSFLTVRVRRHDGRPASLFELAALVDDATRIVMAEWGDGLRCPSCHHDLSMGHARGCRHGAWIIALRALVTTVLDPSEELDALSHATLALALPRPIAPASRAGGHPPVGDAPGAGGDDRTAGAGGSQDAAPGDALGAGGSGDGDVLVPIPHVPGPAHYTIEQTAGLGSGLQLRIHVVQPPRVGLPDPPEIV